MVDFKTLKARSGKKSLDDLNTKLNKLNTNESSRVDDRFWQPTVDKAGNGYAVIRFLDSAEGEDVPFVRTFDHGFKGPGGWYIEKSLTTIGKSDPVTDYNNKLWETGLESNKEIVRKQKRRLHYISNVYVVTDSGNPANEGKVFLFKYGKKIFDKINEAINPPFDDEGRSMDHPNYDPTNSFNPFDFWEGANFKLKIRQVEGYRNYDKSEFATPEPLFDDDKKIEKVWKTQNKLMEFTDPSSFKTYEELQARLNKVLAENTSVNRATRAEDVEEAAPPKFKSKNYRSDDDDEDEDPPFNTSEDDDDGSLEFFKGLAKK
jgi:hypothetical protein